MDTKTETTSGLGFDCLPEGVRETRIIMGFMPESAHKARAAGTGAAGLMGGAIGWRAASALGCYNEDAGFAARLGGAALTVTGACLGAVAYDYIQEAALKWALSDKKKK